MKASLEEPVNSIREHCEVDRSLNVRQAIVVLSRNERQVQKLTGVSCCCVLGSLRGNAYAGAAGDEHTFVAALDMDPVQIKIGNVIGRSSDRGPLSAIKNKRGLFRAAVAVVMDDSILIQTSYKRIINEYIRFRRKNKSGK
ncbi:MAG: septum site-determining protein MinC [Roseburia sp.]